MPGLVKEMSETAPEKTKTGLKQLTDASLQVQVSVVVPLLVVLAAIVMSGFEGRYHLASLSPYLFQRLLFPTAYQWAAYKDWLYLRDYSCNEEHGYRLRVHRREPLIMTLENFLAPGEAEHLIQLGRPALKRSLVASKDSDREDESRTSDTAFLQRGGNKVLKCIERRAGRVVDYPVSHFEPLQIVRYQNGQLYQAHYDYFPDDKPYSATYKERGGQRVVTFFLYLTTVPETHGGHTWFPEANIMVPAVKNTAAVWYDVRPDGSEDNATLHSGTKVHSHEKWGCNIWIRERPYE